MKIVMPRFKVGQRVRPTDAILGNEPELADIVRDKVGRIVSIHPGQTMAIVVVFGHMPDEWGFEESELVEVE